MLPGGGRLAIVGGFFTREKLVICGGWQGARMEKIIRVPVFYFSFHVSIEIGGSIVKSVTSVTDMAQTGEV